MDEETIERKGKSSIGLTRKNILTIKTSQDWTGSKESSREKDSDLPVNRDRILCTGIGDAGLLTNILKNFRKQRPIILPLVSVKKVSTRQNRPRDLLTLTVVDTVTRLPHLSSYRDCSTCPLSPFISVLFRLQIFTTRLTRV